MKYYENNYGALAQFWITDLANGQRVSIPETTRVPDLGGSKPEPPAPGSVTLSWTAPGTCMDGSSISLSEIAYYEIQYGQSPESLTETQRVDAAETSCQFENLAPRTWYFTITVFDTQGRESQSSDAVSQDVE